MTYDILKTGSDGNAVVINGEILIDVGVPYKTLEKSGYIKNLKLVLLTHAHGDHFKPATAGRLHKERPALRWGMCEWMVRPALDAGVSKRVIDVYADGLVLNYPGTGIDAVEAVPLVHDVPNCGYRLNLCGERVFYATDTATLNHVEAKGFDYFLLEANHTRAEIEQRINEKQSRGEFAYESRAAANHLSREQAEEWLARNAAPQSRYIFLHQHQSKEVHERWYREEQEVRDLHKAYMDSKRRKQCELK